jgi:GT2 family glycosyltransferase
MKILVSIVNWNNSAATNRCLAGLAAMERGAQPDVVVVDNGSTVDKLAINEATSIKLRSLKLISNPTNLGFAGGHNPNIKAALAGGYDFVVLLNNDTEIIDKDLFDKLAAALAASPRALGANPTIISSVDLETIWYGGGRLSLKTGWATHLHVGQLATNLPVQPQAVSLLTGGCLMMALKRASLEQLVLNEDYFVYWEDTDWCARALKANFELLYVPQAKLLHHVSSSLGLRSPAYIYYIIRNHILFVRHNLSAVYKPLGWLNIIWVSTKYKLNILLRYRQDRLKSLKALAIGWVDGLRGRVGPSERNW